MPDVGIIVGSDSDLPKIKECFSLLKEFGVSFETIVSSAHRTPQRTVQWASGARDRGIRVIIAAAGGAAHLPGVIAAHTTLPVIGVPIETNVAGGLDSILSIIQMPGGIPVGAMPAGKAGGTNAALFAVSILATCDDAYARKLEAYRKATEVKISERNETLQKEGVDAYIRKTEDVK